MSNRIIRLYGKDHCVQCSASERKLNSLNLDFVHEDATTEDNLKFIQSLDESYKRAPIMTVEVDGEVVDHWTGYDPDRITALA